MKWLSEYVIMAVAKKEIVSKWYKVKAPELQLRGFLLILRLSIRLASCHCRSSFIADTGTYRLCADKVVCKRVYEVKRVLLN